MMIPASINNSLQPYQMDKKLRLQQFQQTENTEESGFSSDGETVSKMGITWSSLTSKLLTIISH